MILREDVFLRNAEDDISSPPRVGFLTPSQPRQEYLARKEPLLGCRELGDLPDFVSL